MSYDQQLADALNEIERLTARIKAWEEDDVETDAEMERLIALNAELVPALDWALPLAAAELENSRQRRLEYGHDDIGSGTDHVGLHESEYLQLHKARAALAKVKEGK